MQKVAIEAFKRCDSATTRASISASRPNGEIYVIEVNPNCYLERESEFARAAAEGGFEYDDAGRADLGVWTTGGIRDRREHPSSVPVKQESSPAPYAAFLLFLLSAAN